MTLRIISAEDVMFDGEVSLVSLPGTNGAFTVLKNHASIISTLTAGTIRYKVDDREETLYVTGGMVDVDDNVVSVCVY